MKKNRLFFVLATLVVGVIMFWSCQKDNVGDIDDSLLLKKAKITAQVVPDALSWGTDPVCAGLSHQYCISFPQKFTGNGGQMHTNGQVQLLVLGDNPATLEIETEYWIEMAHQNSNTGFCFDYTFAMAGNYSLRFKASNPHWSYTTVEVVNCGCEESFTYVANGGDSFTFTYIPKLAMADAELVFTFAQGVAVTGLDDWSTHGSTRQKTMNLVACQSYVFIVTLSPDCSGHSGNSNVWTDFKVNDVSKKGELTNIEIACPQ